MSSFFDVLFGGYNEETGEYEEKSILDIITINATKVAIADMAMEKAANMIAKAIAKSEFMVQRNNKPVKDDIYWMLNVRPNPNETATEFWIETIRKLLINQECVIVHINNYLYRCNSFSVDTAVNKSKQYSNIVIETKEDTLSIARKFKSDDVMHLKNPNKKIQNYLIQTIELYNAIVSGLANGKKLASIPKFELDTGTTSTPILRSKDETGKEITLTIDEYKNKVKKLLESEDIEILTNRSELKIGQLKIDTNITSEDIVKISKEIFTECAYAFDIPKAVFLGEITEKADSTNEFITYAVSWIVELLNDSLNAVVVGKEDFLEKNEKIWIDMSRYKHRDIIDSAIGLDKLRSIGFTFDELLELLGREPLKTEFSKQRALTLNYKNDLGGGSGEEET